MHSMGIIHISHGFALEVISSAHSPLGASVIGLHCFQELSLALLVRWGQNTLFTEVGCDLPPCLDMDKPGSTGSTEAKLLIWIQIRQICTPPSSLVTVVPNLVLQMSKASD